MEDLNYQNPENQYIEHGEYERPNFVEAVKACFKKFVDFSGRARRSEFWYFSLFQFIILVLGLLLIWLCSNVVPVLGAMLAILLFVVIIILAIPGWAVTFRRLHDIGKSGWWYGAYVLISVFINLVLRLMTPSYNSYNYFDDGAHLAMQQQLQLIGIISVVIGLCQLGYWVVLLVFWCRDSDPEENQYGVSPKYY